MSYQHGGQCFATQAEAWASLAAVQAGSVHAAGSALYVLDVSGVSSSGIAYTLHDMLGGGTVSYTVAPAMQPCALLDWSDGLQLGWSVGAVWLLAAAVLFVLRGARVR